MQETKVINKVVYLNNNDILPNRFQPRKYFDEEEIMQLSESIKEHGVINPVIVRKLGDKYELVAGERRYKANILAGNDDIPAIIMDVNDKESSEIAIVENIQRKDLNAIEEAISYKRILDIGYMTQNQLAQKMGKSQSAIANKIRLLKLSDEVQDALMKKQISERHARSLLKVESHKKQNELLERIINERLTVRKTDEEIEKMNNNMNTNFYNNNISNSNNGSGIAPIMPESNVSDVNISGMNLDNSFNGVNNMSTNSNNMNNGVNDVMGNIFNDSHVADVNNASESNVEEQPRKINQQEPVKPQNIPTVSIDDVLAKANQPSVVGQPVIHQGPVQNNSMGNNETSSFNIPDLNPINENVSPINQTNTFEMPNLNPINETTPGQEVGLSNLNSLNNNANLNADFLDIPNLNSPEPTDFMNTFNNNSGQNNDIQNNTERNNDMSNSDMSTNDMSNFGGFNIKRDDNNISPINTSPIIDTTDSAVQNNNEINNIGNNNLVQNPQSQVQFEKVPEPIIVNDYNEQHDPIMPKQENTQPTIDFKTIINLIRKCSQAIENSGYKIETEEYNLDNLYQVVFKIDKQ